MKKIYVNVMRSILNNLKNLSNIKKIFILIF